MVQEVDGDDRDEVDGEDCDESSDGSFGVVVVVNTTTNALAENTSSVNITIVNIIIISFNSSVSIQHRGK